MNVAVELVLSFLLLAGSGFALVGAIATVKLSTFFRRVHGPTKASTLGVGCILLASIAYHALLGSDVHPRELLITVFLFLTAPVGATLMARAALALLDRAPPHPPQLPASENPPVDDGPPRE